MTGIGFAIVAAIARLLGREGSGERPVEPDEELMVSHHHVSWTGQLEWHRHLTNLRRHPYPWERAHPGMRDG